MQSFSPASVRRLQGSERVTITGIGLDPVLSVGQVRFEPGTNCTATVAGARAGTTVASGVRFSDATLNRLTVEVGGGGLAAEQYAVCAQFVWSNTTVGGFVQVGSTQLLAGECVRANDCGCVC